MDRRRRIRMSEAEVAAFLEELRGVSMECDAELVRDPARVLDWDHRKLG